MVIRCCCLRSRRVRPPRRRSSSRTPRWRSCFRRAWMERSSPVVERRIRWAVCLEEITRSQSGNKKGKQSNFAKLSIFQPNKYKFKKSCPLSVKGAPVVDYKNIRLLRKYVSENGKILPSRITNISQKKQRELSLSIKRARNLALI